MPTYSKEFRSLVQGSIFRMEENMVFFMHTDSADVGDGIVWCGSFHNIPSQSFIRYQVTMSN